MCPLPKAGPWEEGGRGVGHRQPPPVTSSRVSKGQWLRMWLPSNQPFILASNVASIVASIRTNTRTSSDLLQSFWQFPAKLFTTSPTLQFVLLYHLRKVQALSPWISMLWLYIVFPVVLAFLIVLKDGTGTPNAIWQSIEFEGPPAFEHSNSHNCNLVCRHHCRFPEYCSRITVTMLPLGYCE